MCRLVLGNVMPQSRGPWDKLQLVSGGIRKGSGQAESLSHLAAQAIAPETEASLATAQSGSAPMSGWPRDNPVCWQTGAGWSEQPRSPKSLNPEPRSIGNHACRLPSLRKQKTPVLTNSQLSRTPLELGWNPPPPLPRLPLQVCGAHLAAFQLEVCSMPQVLADGLKLVV